MDEKSGRRKLREGKETVFHHLYQSDLPPKEKTATRLSREGIVMVGAGSETAGIAMSVSTFHLLDNPDKLSKLRSELVTALPDPNVIPGWGELYVSTYHFLFHKIGCAGDHFRFLRHVLWLKESS